MSHKVISIVLGGGRGTRLFPLTYSRSKPAVPIAGKYRLVDIPISNCLNAGYNKILVLTQFNSASLNSHIKNTYHFDIFSRGFVDILAAEQNVENDQWYHGTADAVRQSMKHITDEYDYVLILSGDQLYQMDFRELIEFHCENKGDITVATIPVNAKDATGFGILKSDENDKITSFVEKPGFDVLQDWKSEVSEKNQGEGKEFLASMGIYVFNKKVLTKLFEEDPGDDFGKDLIPNAISNGYNTLSFQYDGYWTDIGTIESFFEANMDLTAEMPKFNLFSQSPIFTRARMLPPSKINGSYVSKAIFGDGCIILADKIENAVIGNRTRIDTGSTIMNSYIMGSDYYEDAEFMKSNLANGGVNMGVGKYCYIENAILDKNCRIGNHVKIIGGNHMPDGDYDTYSVKDGIVVVKKGATIPDGTHIA